MDVVWCVDVVKYVDMTHSSQPATSSSCFVYRSRMKEFYDAFEK